ncbi:hypothetical protein EG850_12805 [Gulosibacter macacae]|uniref:Asparagine synthase n=1 Tax=Gulosibacter macacae TaxID=2488791 RepID=A0A3P3VY41_9MICO|nr:hypothetical protein [Gulosibacter macacae]RRJ85593.1 hypothetical protein EG850_12805 [Gulosibacter macacae]
MTTSSEAKGADSGAAGDDEVAHLVDEGLLIANSALRMRVKNRIVMQVLGEGRPVDVPDFREFVREEAADLVAESRASAERLAKEAASARRRTRTSVHASDYVRADWKAVDLRSRVDAALADELERLVTTPEFRREIAEESRRVAMDEMFRARMLTTDTRPYGDDEQDERDEQRRELGKELEDLVREHDAEERRAERKERRREVWRRLMPKRGR